MFCIYGFKIDIKFRRSDKLYDGRLIKYIYCCIIFIMYDKDVWINYFKLFCSGKIK